MKTMLPEIKKLCDELGVDNLYSLYRAVYKTTACGPSIGFLFLGETTEYSIGSGELETFDHEYWIYCDEIPTNKLSEVEDLYGEVVGICVGSIVEGTDYDCQTIYLWANSDEHLPSYTHRKLTKKNFWQAIKDVNNEANEIWDDTHGCDDCYEGTLNEYGYHTIDPKCKSCHGEGVIL